MLDLDTLKQDAATDISAAEDLSTLETVRVNYLGKKGRITELLKQLPSLPPEERPQQGKQINVVKRDILDLLESKQEHFKSIELESRLASERIDVTMPGRQSTVGHQHPVTQVKQRIQDYFSRLGFDIVSGPEVETEAYNFEALNIPDHHPARAMHDTFYFGDGRLLRTHTSPVQIRTLEQRRPPIRMIALGRVYRCDSDVTHTPMFHQVEGLLIDDKATMASLKGILQQFFSWFFGRELSFRFRPSYFPFTEPSAEMDIECTSCNGQGCRSCKYTGWLEVGGAGMIHPNVYKAVNISPQEYQGWAFGIGVDRLAMLYYGIDDLRMMFGNDVSFLKQF